MCAIPTEKKASLPKGAAVFILTLSSLSFAMSTVFAKFAHEASPALSGFQVSLFRFALGLVFMIVFIRRKGRSVKPNNVRLVVWRGVLNTAAVLTLYVSLKYTTVTKANMLNWSFPVFVFLVSPFVNKEKPGLVKYLFLVLAVAGIYFVVDPDFSSINPGDVSAFASAVLGAAAVCVLRESRKYDDSYVILFYLMLIGLVLNACFSLPVFTFPPPRVWSFILSSALCGFLGQITITVSSKHFEAAVSSLLMESGFLFSVFLGVAVFGDPVTAGVLWGGALIGAALVGASGIFDRKPGGAVSSL